MQRRLLRANWEAGAKMGFNNSWFGGVSSYADAVKKAANLQDLTSSAEARDNLGVYSKGEMDAGGNFAALRVRIKGTSSYGYVVLEKDADGNLSPVYLTETEYESLAK